MIDLGRRRRRGLLRRTRLDDVEGLPWGYVALAWMILGYAESQRWLQMEEHADV